MIARVLLRFVLSLFLASVVIFLLLRLIPGDPARVALGVTATDEAVEALARQLGTDRPLVVQYLDWVGGLLTGDFGMSLASRQDITPLIIDRAQVSLILCGLAMVLSLLIALPLGMWTANRVLPTLAQIGIAIPSFLTGILLVTVFSVHLGWVPANGWIPPGTDFLGFLQRNARQVIARDTGTVILDGEDRFFAAGRGAHCYFPLNRRVLDRVMQDVFQRALKLEAVCQDGQIARDVNRDRLLLAFRQRFKRLDARLRHVQQASRRQADGHLARFDQREIAHLLHKLR